MKCALLLAAFGFVACASEAMPVKQPNVILIVVDTLRMDHTNLDGYERETTPFLAELVAEGAYSLQNVRASAPWTKPSVASILTGLDPREHGVLGHPDRLHSSNKTLAEIYHDAGYQTAAFQSNLLLSSVFGYDQGFDSYNEEFLAGHRESTGAGLNAAVAKWLDEERDPDRPFFLYIHHFEPHFDYLRSGEEWVADYDGPLTGAETMDQLIGATDKLRTAELRFLASRYDAEIQYQDQLLHELWGEFGQRGLQDDVLLAVTADHGEEFGEHGDISHQYKMYDELLHVPLVIRTGAGAARGLDPSACELGVSLKQLGATLLDLSGVKADFAGPSMAGVFVEFPVLSHSMLHDGSKEMRNVDMVFNGREKLIRIEGTSGQAEQLLYFDTVDDPQEKLDLSQASPERVRSLLNLLESTLARRAKEGPLDLKTESILLDEGTLQRMRDLGYF
jgi:arylsulfatase A-like enzyme